MHVGSIGSLMSHFVKTDKDNLDVRSLYNRRQDNVMWLSEIHEGKFQSNNI